MDNNSDTQGVAEEEEQEHLKYSTMLDSDSCSDENLQPQDFSRILDSDAQIIHSIGDPVAAYPVDLDESFESSEMRYNSEADEMWSEHVDNVTDIKSLMPSAKLFDSNDLVSLKKVDREGSISPTESCHKALHKAPHKSRMKSSDNNSCSRSRCSTVPGSMTSQAHITTKPPMLTLVLVNTSDLQTDVMPLTTIESTYGSQRCQLKMSHKEIRYPSAVRNMSISQTKSQRPSVENIKPSPRIGIQLSSHTGRKSLKIGSNYGYSQETQPSSHYNVNRNVSHIEREPKSSSKSNITSSYKCSSVTEILFPSQKQISSKPKSKSRSQHVAQHVSNVDSIKSQEEVELKSSSQLHVTESKHGVNQATSQKETELKSSSQTGIKCSSEIPYSEKTIPSSEKNIPSSEKETSSSENKIPSSESSPQKVISSKIKTSSIMELASSKNNPKSSSVKEIKYSPQEVKSAYEQAIKSASKTAIKSESKTAIKVSESAECPSLQRDEDGMSTTGDTGSPKVSVPDEPAASPPSSPSRKQDELSRSKSKPLRDITSPYFSTFKILTPEKSMSELEVPQAKSLDLKSVCWGNVKSSETSTKSKTPQARVSTSLVCKSSSTFKSSCLSTSIKSSLRGETCHGNQCKTLTDHMTLQLTDMRPASGMYKCDGGQAEAATAMLLVSSAGGDMVERVKLTKLRVPRTTCPPANTGHGPRSHLLRNRGHIKPNTPGPIINTKCNVRKLHSEPITGKHGSNACRYRKHVEHKSLIHPVKPCKSPISEAYYQDGTLHVKVRRSPSPAGSRKPNVGELQTSPPATKSDGSDISVASRTKSLKVDPYVMPPFSYPHFDIENPFTNNVIENRSHGPVFNTMLLKSRPKKIPIVRMPLPLGFIKKKHLKGEHPFEYLFVKWGKKLDAQ